MKNILYISTYFPPAGGVGVQRISKFCKYLSRRAYKAFVLTPAAWSLKRDRDESMLADLPEQLELINPGFIDIRRLIPGEIAKHLKAWERQYLFPDNLIQWVRKVQTTLPQLLVDKQIDLVYITVPHFSLLNLVPVIKANSKVRVITDLRDPFSFNFYTRQVSDPAYQKRVTELEKMAFASSDLILTVTQQINAEYQQRYPQWESRFCYIPNGYDDDDFPLAIPDINSLANKHLTLCYTGSYSSMASIMPYRDAISEIFHEQGIRIILKLLAPNKVKRIKRDFKELIKLKLLDFHGFAPHKEAISQLLSSHVLLYPVPGFFSGKIYEYIRAERPILCAVQDERDSHQVIRDAGTGIFVALEQPQGLKEALLMLHKQWENKSLETKPNWDYIRSFSCEQRTGQLVKAIQELQ